MVGELDVPASTLTCAGCHGLRGEGKTEGGVTAGNLTWSNLVKPYGHTHPSGRKHGPFDEKLFTRSLVQGLDPAGNELAVAMPRYRDDRPKTSPTSSRISNASKPTVIRVSRKQASRSPRSCRKTVRSPKPARR